MAKGEAKPRQDLVTRECTIHLHKRLHGVTFKKRAPRAVREIKKFATKMMGTNDVRVDTKLNKALWSQGIRNVPRRVRLRLSRLRNDDEDAEEKLYTLVEYVHVKSFKELQTQTVEDVDEE
uniref:60S ribosomal protein L31 n=1 Tax=Rhizochromulina marina TaxID=1034831 RepID=A0A7S2WUX3_9STRA|eukprot:CAMPEP_0118973698 /NCGR_PEP_ID=MMETSP1173-20130426/10756_1 /TAXON_ID=1034831 /ORGANISM="Rhizochromulina marina cf, Strain CCMP1243" /LENGTH=120 /DNA_ID=CAMNT_0006923389 /DNA_START=33 /DNA_END=395 /DNA_ORIENTATION=+